MPSHLSARLSLLNALGTELTEARIRLLEAIERDGSISQAAKAVPLSYKAAWDAVDQINNLSERPLVARATGGAGGGGTRLTPYGKQVVALYRALEADYQSTVARITAALDQGEASDIEGFRRLVQRLQWRSSARNQFHGRIERIAGDGVESEVQVRLDDATVLAAVITGESVENLELAEGVEVLALIKASSVMIAREDGLRISARNQLWGEVSRVHEGPVNDEITVALPSGRSIAAVITRASSEALELSPGVRACAFFKASSVLLARPS
ncbi:TOBE domain-containing protein [Pseudomonas matsuisoli]|uniref:ModE family transcriptional regulator n=1 Tax=Pseudomonas matsuisoli TaxID=1515666 RepID=A0A917Q0U1_9PSED|nr:TOBE domain-containing protein [Pseudomonas matsuisoli]GGK04096.1 ModE family transcriptional regulator [Pseudomonas matsuisoli]